MSFSSLCAQATSIVLLVLLLPNFTARSALNLGATIFRSATLYNGKKDFERKVARLIRQFAASLQRDEKADCTAAGEELSEEARLVPLEAIAVHEEEERGATVFTVSDELVSLNTSFEYLSCSCVQFHHSECAGAGYIGNLNKTYVLASDRLNFNLL
jgi:hypothetical protein